MFSSSNFFNFCEDYTHFISLSGTPCKYITPLQGLSSYTSATYEAGCSNVGCTTAQVDRAKEIASAADATVLVMGTDQSIEAESRDRVDLYLPGQQPLLVAEVANVSKGPVVLVIMSGGGVDITFAKNNDKISSILWVGYPGEAGGAAMADIIFGTCNPSESSRMLSFTFHTLFNIYPTSYVIHLKGALKNIPFKNKS